MGVEPPPPPKRFLIILRPTNSRPSLMINCAACALRDARLKAAERPVIERGARVGNLLVFERQLPVSLVAAGGRGWRKWEGVKRRIRAPVLTSQSCQNSLSLLIEH